MKLWSISTTVRNPERLRNFLQVLKLLEGQPFDKEHQKKYQILLIQNRYYIPKQIPDKFKHYYQNIESEMPYEVAEKIFSFQEYEDPAMRGRQSVNPLNKLGFCIARESIGNIIITELGNQFLEDEYDISYIFLKSLLKLQFPNPWSSDFSKNDGFDVQPLIATMHLIDEVNKKSKEKKGLTQTEFSLFVPSLINYKLIPEYTNKIFEYRKTENKEEFIKNFAKEFYKTDKLKNEQIKNFFEYGDNIMRYFRLTKLFKVTTDKFGGNWAIDLEPSRRTEIDQILTTFSGQALEFKKLDDYIRYITDITLPKLPFEEIENLKAIAKNLMEDIKNNRELKDEEKELLSTDFNKYSKNELNVFIEKLRILNLNIKNRDYKNYLKNNINEIQNIINSLKNFKEIKKYEPEKFEKLITDALRILNDEIEIRPNYPVDDNGEPISHASGKKPDIECFYQNYNAICEVTLETSNFQWIKETQPVMRHLRDFEKKYSEKNNYCLFIAPKIHVDTVYHFWISIKYGYDQKKQNIIPITTEQFAEVLEILLILWQRQKRLSHLQLKELYDLIISKANEFEGYSNWISIIPDLIKEWKSKVLNYGN
ncbi:hypothetical protein BREVNS_2076 [Brevinematales bacterium NS]|nr:hypothetical protein BREVNS_2076 [Brevinematales bacterium NS]